MIFISYGKLLVGRHQNDCMIEATWVTFTGCTFVLPFQVKVIACLDCLRFAVITRVAIFFREMEATMCHGCICQ